MGKSHAAAMTVAVFGFCGRDGGGGAPAPVESLKAATKALFDSEALLQVRHGSKKVSLPVCPASDSECHESVEPPASRSLRG